MFSSSSPLDQSHSRERLNLIYFRSIHELEITASQQTQHDRQLNSSSSHADWNRKLWVMIFGVNWRDTIGWLTAANNKCECQQQDEMWNFRVLTLSSWQRQNLPSTYHINLKLNVKLSRISAALRRSHARMIRWCDTNKMSVGVRLLRGFSEDMRWMEKGYVAGRKGAPHVPVITLYLARTHTQQGGRETENEKVCENI